ncbi:hypothetical protein HDU93_003337 [Gonapodya sp. JEL0774]|nr:hypothetical protein HDU93_003337 [Gonapodya sp. JEL0774]
MASQARRLLLSLLVVALLFLAVVRADDHDHDHDHEDQTEAAKHAPVANFKRTNIKAPFLEQFTDDWESRWTVSQAKKVIDGVEDEDLLRYRGTWSVEEPTVLHVIEGDKGLVVKTPAAHHCSFVLVNMKAVAAKFSAPINPKGKPLVVQYEVKLQNGLECGGAYLKLLKESKTYDFTKFEDKTPYVIMFGPDKCGSTNKVHFIFKHKNPKTGEYEEKHANSPPAIKSDKLSNLYTLIVNPDNTFEILVNNESEKTGSLLEDVTPSVNPPKEIDDPKDVKPTDWVDEAEIVDPKAFKPADWNEDAPEFIPDPDDVKPEDWLDDEPLTIPDPKEPKPEDWDEEEDGEWVAPSIRVWAPRKIPNPNYFEDLHPADFEPIGALGFEIWTMQENVLFDNIYIGHSVADAKKFAEETWAVKYTSEKALEEAENPKPTTEEEKNEGVTGSFLDSVKAFFSEFAKDPTSAVEKRPSVAIGVLVVLGSVVLITAVSSSLGQATPETKSEVETKKDEKETPKPVEGKAEKKEEGVKKRSAVRKEDS